jgi:hypothetical protein
MATERTLTGLKIAADIAAVSSILTVVACEWMLFSSIVSNNGLLPTLITIIVIDMFPFAFGFIWLLYRCRNLSSRYPFVARWHLPEHILTIVILLPAFLLHLRAK